MSILKTGARSTLARAGVGVAVVAAAVGGVATTANATNPSMSLSSSTGSSAGGNTLTLTIGSTATTKFSSGSVAVLFSATTATAASAANCPGTTGTSNSVTSSISTTSVTSTTTGVLFSGTVRYLATTKVSATVPDLRANVTTTPAAGPTTWLVCAYNAAATGVTAATASGTPSAGAGSLTASSSAPVTLIGKAVYTVASAPLISDGTNNATVGVNWGAGGVGGASAVTAVVPATGPALGSQTVTVWGANFPTGTISSTNPLSATLGGSALSSITPIDQYHFTAVTPAHAATAVALTVTTNGGTVSASSAFTYKNGISISPTTVPSGSSVDVDVQGVGFSGLTWGTTDGTATSDDGAHVYLVNGDYDPTTYDGTHDKDNGQVAECTDVAVISDSELICTVNATNSVTSTKGTGAQGTTDLANGAYTLYVISDGDQATEGSLTYETVLSSGATFTVADF